MKIIRLLIMRILIGKQRRMHLRTLLAALKPKPF